MRKESARNVVNPIGAESISKLMNWWPEYELKVFRYQFTSHTYILSRYIYCSSFSKHVVHVCMYVLNIASNRGTERVKKEE